MDKLYHIVGVLLLATLATGSLFAFVALNPQAFAEERQLRWCGTPDSPEGTDKYQPIRHPGRSVFNNNCATCHVAVTTEVIVGPSLKGVMQRREEPWVRQMIRDGQKLVAQKDSAALAQYQKYGKRPHPDFS
ncbi:MAG: c-type cytochrome [Cytophagales bacterium]|nr:c-type cytochrome [Cytophagales bacterium]